MHTIGFLALVQLGLPAVDVADAGAQLVGNGGDRFGYQTASGDLDADGDLDLVVTAPHQSGGNAVYVFFGPVDLSGSTVLDPTMADVAIQGDVPDETGWSVTVGDVMGDETVDLVIGSPSDLASYEGTVQVFEAPLVPGDHRIADASYVVEGHVAGGYAGWAVAAGDFDGDDRGELVIGACGENAADGAAYILDLDEGPQTTADATTRFAGMGLTGCSLANAGDFNGDGLDDLVIGSFGTAQLFPASYAGGVSLVYGRSSFDPSYDLLNGDPIVDDIARIRGTAIGGNFGFDIAPAGDLNLDGFADVLVGAPARDCEPLPPDMGLDCILRDRTGRMFVVLGTPDTAPGGGTGRGLHGTSDANAVADLTFEGDPAGDWTGISVAGAGYVGKAYGRFTGPFVPANVFHYGKVMMIGTGDHIGYAIPYDFRPRLAAVPKYVCTFDPELGLVCELTEVPDPDGPQPRQIVKRLASMSFGGHVFTGAAPSYFGLEVQGADLDGDGGGDLVFGAPHQPIYDAPAGDGEAYVFAGK